jgi:hypothetical protein
MLKIITLSLSALVLFNFDAQGMFRCCCCCDVDSDDTYGGASRRPLKGEVLEEDRIKQLERKRAARAAARVLVYITDDRIKECFSEEVFRCSDLDKTLNEAREYDEHRVSRYRIDLNELKAIHNDAERLLFIRGICYNIVTFQPSDPCWP